jgi:hypothetical protein
MDKGAKVQKRKGEKLGARRRRGREVAAAETATAAADREAQHAPWRARWEKETGKKYGIATAGEYNAWLKLQRKKLAGKKQSGQTAKKQGEALAPEKKKD